MTTSDSLIIVGSFLIGYGGRTLKNSNLLGKNITQDNQGKILIVIGISIVISSFFIQNNK